MKAAIVSRFFIHLIFLFRQTREKVFPFPFSSLHCMSRDNIDDVCRSWDKVIFIEPSRDLTWNSTFFGAEGNNQWIISLTETDKDTLNYSLAITEIRDELVLPLPENHLPRAESKSHLSSTLHPPQTTNAFAFLSTAKQQFEVVNPDREIGFSLLHSICSRKLCLI